MKVKAYPKYKNSGVAWLGEVPEHWDSLPIRRRLLGIKDGTHGSFERVSEGIPLLSAKNVLNGQIIIGDNESLISREDWADITSNGFPRLGDILLTIVGSIGRTAVFNINKPMAFQRSVAFLRFQKNQVSEFIRYGIESASFQAQLQSFTKVAAQGGTYMGDVVRGILAFPPETEQQIISDFLDRETDKIDNLLAKKRALIEKLKEKRTALISRTVTSGLPPEVARAAGLDPHPKLKPSGVEWLEDVPEHWEVKPIKWETPVQRGASPRPIDDPIYFDDVGEYAWVRISDVTSAGMYLRSTTQRLSDLGSSLSVKLNPGEIFLSIAGSVGKSCITAIKCCIHDGFVYFPKWKGDKRYLFYLFECGEPYKGLGKLGTQLNLNTDTVGSIIAGFPPLNEQNFICDFLDQATAKIDQLIAKVSAAIDRLQEYRTALITAAVTGKIDVRETQV